MSAREQERKLFEEREIDNKLYNIVAIKIFIYVSENDGCKHQEINALGFNIPLVAVGLNKLRGFSLLTQDENNRYHILKDNLDNLEYLENE